MSGVATVVSARSASSRLPGKALLDLCGAPMLQFLIERLRGTRLGGPVIFATTQRADDDRLAAHVESLGVPVFRGADADVAGRHLAAAKAFGIDWIVRVTGDCPFVDAESLDHCLAQWNPSDGDDLVSTKGVFPMGIDYELFPTALLEREWPRMSDEEKEHLTLRFYRRELGFSVRYFERPASWPVVDRTYVVDTPADYQTACARARRFDGRRFAVRDLLLLPDV
jgi:spore coat polysaccharide biosynthesis protein SpsF (cytidylyltransferase family)